jgi:hypothetical protein
MMTVLRCGSCGGRVGRAGLVLPDGRVYVGVRENRWINDIATLSQSEAMGGPVDEMLPYEWDCVRCGAPLCLDVDQAHQLGSASMVLVRQRDGA